MKASGFKNVHIVPHPYELIPSKGDISEHSCCAFPEDHSKDTHTDVEGCV